MSLQHHANIVETT